MPNNIKDKQKLSGCDICGRNKKNYVLSFLLFEEWNSPVFFCNECYLSAIAQFDKQFAEGLNKNYISYIIKFFKLSD